MQFTRRIGVWGPRVLSVVRSWHDSSRGSQEGNLGCSEGLTETGSLENFSCAILPGREPINRARHPLNSGHLTLPISLERLVYTKTHQAVCVYVYSSRVCVCVCVCVCTSLSQGWVCSQEYPEQA